MNNLAGTSHQLRPIGAENYPDKRKFLHPTASLLTIAIQLLLAQSAQATTNPKPIEINPATSNVESIRQPETVAPHSIESLATEGIPSISFETLKNIKLLPLKEVQKTPVFDSNIAIPEEIQRKIDIILATSTDSKFIIDPVKRDITMSGYDEQKPSQLDEFSPATNPFSLDLITNFPPVEQYLIECMRSNIYPESLRKHITFSQSTFLPAAQRVVSQEQLDQLALSTVTLFFDTKANINKFSPIGSGTIIDKVLVTNAHVARVYDIKEGSISVFVSNGVTPKRISQVDSHVVLAKGSDIALIGKPEDIKALIQKLINQNSKNPQPISQLSLPQFGTVVSNRRVPFDKTSANSIDTNLFASKFRAGATNQLPIVLTPFLSSEVVKPPTNGYQNPKEQMSVTDWRLSTSQQGIIGGNSGSLVMTTNGYNEGVNLGLATSSGGGNVDTGLELDNFVSYVQRLGVLAGPGESSIFSPTPWSTARNGGITPLSSEAGKDLQQQFESRQKLFHQGSETNTNPITISRTELKSRLRLIMEPILRYDSVDKENSIERDDVNSRLQAYVGAMNTLDTLGYNPAIIDINKAKIRTQSRQLFQEVVVNAFGWDTDIRDPQLVMAQYDQYLDRRKKTLFLISELKRQGLISPATHAACLEQIRKNDGTVVSNIDVDLTFLLEQRYDPAYINKLKSKLLDELDRLIREK